MALHIYGTNYMLTVVCYLHGMWSQNTRSASETHEDFSRCRGVILWFRTKLSRFFLANKICLLYQDIKFTVKIVSITIILITSYFLKIFTIIQIRIWTPGPSSELIRFADRHFYQVPPLHLWLLLQLLLVVLWAILVLDCLDDPNGKPAYLLSWKKLFVCGAKIPSKDTTREVNDEWFSSHIFSHFFFPSIAVNRTEASGPSYHRCLC